jgi:hypothetical protein
VALALSSSAKVITVWITMKKNVSATVLLLAMFVLFDAALPAQTEQLTPPALPVFAWHECPFEGCMYGPWTAAARVTLYSTWKKSRHKVGALNAGDKVVGVTGVVITFKPGLIRIDRDFTGSPPDNLAFKRGDTILTYAYHGEGETAAWFKGRYYEHLDMTFAAGAGGCLSDCFATYIDEGQKEWWAEVKLRSGKTAWVLMDGAKFTGVDALG